MKGSLVFSLLLINDVSANDIFKNVRPKTLIQRSAQETVQNTASGVCSTMIPPSELPPDNSSCWQWWEAPANGILPSDAADPPKGCDYKPCEDAVCACDSYCCESAWDLSCRGYQMQQGDILENNYFEVGCSARLLCCEPETAYPKPSVGAALPGIGSDSVLSCEPGSPGCCDTMDPPSYLPPDDSTCWQWWDPPADGIMQSGMAEPQKGCNYKPCESAVCGCDSYCCETAWDLSCRGYEGAQGDSTENNYFVDKCSAKLLCCEPESAYPDPPVGGANPNIDVNQVSTGSGTSTATFTDTSTATFTGSSTTTASGTLSVAPSATPPKEKLRKGKAGAKSPKSKGKAGTKGPKSKGKAGTKGPKSKGKAGTKGPKSKGKAGTKGPKSKGKAGKKGSKSSKKGSKKSVIPTTTPGTTPTAAPTQTSTFTGTFTGTTTVTGTLTTLGTTTLTSLPSLTGAAVPVGTQQTTQKVAIAVPAGTQVQQKVIKVAVPVTTQIAVPATMKLAVPVTSSIVNAGANAIAQTSAPKSSKGKAGTKGPKSKGKGGTKGPKSKGKAGTKGPKSKGKAGTKGPKSKGKAGKKGSKSSKKGSKKSVSPITLTVIPTTTPVTTPTTAPTETSTSTGTFSGTSSVTGTGSISGTSSLTSTSTTP